MRVLLVSGSLREGSTNTAPLETVGVVAPSGVTTVLYRGIATLPHFNPDADREGQSADRAVAELREQVAAADALLICTSEYAGALAGATKNLFDWTVGDATYHKTVAWINASGPRRRRTPPTPMIRCAKCWATSMQTSPKRRAPASR
jgi:NAD(P)H-dependent FMN reductase